MSAAEVLSEFFAEQGVAELALANLAAAGYHVVPEGQAVVDGEVCSVVPINWDTTIQHYWLRPLTDESTT